ncbi:MAG: DNA-binding FadR family transcriptional regulator [Flavobacterium sp.]|jgi:DNA-binding FadR family transcriptional regulator
MNKRNRLYREVADKIALLIKNGKYQVGGRLPSERELASTMRVSRPTIREAMIALEIAGQIEVRTGAGIFILDPETRGDLGLVADIGPGPFELIEARIHFEGEAAALAALRISEGELQDLDKACKEMAHCVEKNKSAEQADQTFHERIASATRNSAIISTIEQLWSFRTRMPMWTRLHEIIANLEGEPGWTNDRKTLMDHQRILNALRARDSEAARHAMRTHLEHVREALLKASEHDAISENVWVKSE